MSESIEKVLQEVASAWDAYDMQRFGDAFGVNAAFVITFGDSLRGREQIVNDS